MNAILWPLTTNRTLGLRRLLALATLMASLLISGPVAAEKASLTELSRYLNTIRMVEAGFTQSNADGTTSRGTLYIARPGRIRFEYDPPNNDTLVVASGGQVAVFDGRAAPEQFPLRRTPLNLILARNIDLTRISMVTGHGEENGRTIVQAQDPEHPEYGRIYLYFDRNPMRLSEWLIVSESGEHTRVRLDRFTEREGFSNFLFDFNYIARERG